MITELEAINKRMQNARIMKVEGALDNDDFISLKTISNTRIEVIEKQLANLSEKHSEINKLLPNALKRVSELDFIYKKRDS